MHTSDFINRISESETLAAARIARELKAQGKDVIALNIGEPDFNTPDFIKEAAINAINNNYSKYPPVNGYLELREAISKKFKRDNNLDYSADQIVVSTGAKHSIVNVVLSLVNPGDEVLLFSPYWVSYKAMGELSGATVVEAFAGVEKDYKIDADLLREKLSDKTRLVMFSSPCNPTGSVYTEAELKSLAKVLVDYPNAIIISDEIYEHINFIGKHVSIGTFPELKDRVVTVNGVSKGFAMTGYRIGYIGAPMWIAKACATLQGQFTSGACGISQMAAKAAVESDPKDLNYMQVAFEKRKKIVVDALTQIEGIKVNDPTGAFYVFPEVSGLYGKKMPDGGIINSATDFCTYRLETQYLSVVTGQAFGAEHCFRISYATSEEELVRAMERIKTAVSLLV